MPGNWTWYCTSSWILTAGTTSQGTTTASITPDASDSGTCGTGMPMALAPSAVRASPVRRLGKRTLRPCMPARSVIGLRLCRTP